MARHQRYDRHARLSRVSASAAFDSARAYFNTREMADAAVDALWSRMRIKARIISPSNMGGGVDVVFERSPGFERNAEVRKLLRDMGSTNVLLAIDDDPEFLKKLGFDDRESFQRAMDEVSGDDFAYLDDLEDEFDEYMGDEEEE